MTFQQARQALDAAYQRGDIDADTWQHEREALEYAHGETQSAQDDAREVTA